MKWLDPKNAPFLISGFPYFSQEQIYRRLSVDAQGYAPNAVDGLANETSGGQIRFHGKLNKLSVQVKLMSKPYYFANTVTAPHLASVNKSAFDLYLSKDGGEYVFCDVAKGMSEGTKEYTYHLFSLNEAEEFDFLLNFPLYGGVDEILIGVNDEAEISAPQRTFATDKKLAIYGSSIQQGACASRPGMNISKILSRWLNTEVYNLGFNSSGKAEPEMAEIISQIPDLSALVISIEGNCPDGTWLDEKLRDFLEIYREKHPETPVILMPFVAGGTDMLNPAKLKDRMARRAVQQKIVEDLRAAGDENIHLLLRDEYLEAEFDGHPILHEATVDVLHYTDLGYFWSTQVLYQFLKKLL